MTKLGKFTNEIGGKNVYKYTKIQKNRTKDNNNYNITNMFL